MNWHTILAINMETAKKCHNSLNFHRREMIFFFKIRVCERSIEWDQAGSCIFIRLEMRAERRKHMLFAGGKKWRKKWHSTPQCHHLSIFLLLIWVFFTMPSEKRLSLNNKGAIVALRGEGHSLRVIGRKLEIAHSTVFSSISFLLQKAYAFFFRLSFLNE